MLLESRICEFECKNYNNCEKDYNRNPSTCTCNTSATDCNEIIIFIDNVITKKTNTITTKNTNTIAKNVTSTVSLNCHSKKVRDCFILDTVLLANIISLITIIICYYYPKQKGLI